MEKQPTSYSDNSPGYNPAPGYPNQTGYPHGQPYGAPYQGQAQGPYPGQPAVTVQPTIYMAAAPLAQPLPDYLGYSIFTLLCCCLPLGVAALVFSMKTRDANTSGNRPVAERNSRTAFILNNTALGIGIVFTIVYIVLIVIINMSY
ncbi:synapse differentiation-inducing gene protein 1-like [Pygocentrus nattereri]|uniref:synapse differentiation-inducing gene protein 1-like n=1 Tax=Pygocentrus nattereri TaxID=42514 RepID=UPI001890E3FE|nr:synapse differentiation-inducing gene protein 1-like [Pygocentrus nattereri]